MALENLRIKWLAAYYVATATKVVPVRKLTLRRMTLEPHRYAGLAEGLAELPLPDTLRIGRRRMAIPQTLDELSSSLTYGQRMYLTQHEGYDVGVILRLVAGYYYPLYTGRPWDERKALSFGAKVLSSLVVELYPVSKHLIGLMEQLTKRESTLLHREPTKQEKAAGIERLAKFADLTALLFLQDSFKTSAEQIMLAPYDDCLVRFMLANEQNKYAERLAEVHRKENAPKKNRKP